VQCLGSGDIFSTVFLYFSEASLLECFLNLVSFHSGLDWYPERETYIMERIESLSCIGEYTHEVEVPGYVPWFDTMDLEALGNLDAILECAMDNEGEIKSDNVISDNLVVILLDRRKQFLYHSFLTTIEFLREKLSGLLAVSSDTDSNDLIVGREEHILKLMFELRFFVELIID
jgi:hypothetical protein